MKIVEKISIISVIITLLLSSCASRKDILYLQDLDKDKGIAESIKFTAPTFKTDDRITINISSVNPEAARPFNLYITSFNTSGTSAGGGAQQQSYLVDANGEIGFPQLGKLKVIGKTRIELESFLEEKLRPFLPDVKANVQLVNFRISILGEIKKPGQYSIDREKFSVLQAISIAGDLNIHGKREQIKLLREIDGEIHYFNLNLTDSKIINSPYFYLQQNDILYIPPNKPKINASTSSPTASYIISATSLLITVISLLTR